MVAKPPLANAILKNHEAADSDIDLENLSGHAGQPLAAGKTVATSEAIITAMKTVEDPEIPVNLYDLGLIYDHQIKANGDVKVKMTLTSPTCPTANELPQMIAEAIAKVEGIGVVDVQVIWDPPWNMDMMSEEARFELDLF